jgi:hypothetical protein
MTLPSSISLAAALISLGLATEEALAGQYRFTQPAVSSAGFVVVSPYPGYANGTSISAENSLEIRLNSVVNVALDRSGPSDKVQYQTPRSEPQERRLALQIGIGLAAAYVGFLACWIWATRLRGRARRH